MRTLPLLGALALFGLAVQPASAQMCGGGQQAQASTPAQGAMDGMMCGGMGAAAQDDPMADKPAQKPQASGMCQDGDDARRRNDAAASWNAGHGAAQTAMRFL